MRRGFKAIKTTLPVFYGRRARAERAVGYSGTSGYIGPSVKETEYLPPDVFERIREFLVAAREAGGPALGIAVDCHGRLSPKAAITLCRRVEDLDLLFLEEPIPPEHPEALAEVRRATTVPIAAGERWATIHGVREFLERRSVDVLQCDLVNCGGITGMRKIAALAEAQYVGLAPHNPNGPVATAMNLHLAAAIPNFLILETVGSCDDDRLFGELTSPPLVRRDGHGCLPTGPGYGISLRHDAFAAHPYEPFNGFR